MLNHPFWILFQYTLELHFIFGRQALIRAVSSDRARLRTEQTIATLFSHVAYFDMFFSAFDRVRCLLDKQ